MEAVRPEVDRWLLERINHQIFTARDFHETTEGQCRILPPLTYQLSDTMPVWRAAIAPVVERIAELLAQPSKPIATPLTGRKRREAWKERPAYNPKPCKQCGNPVSVKTRKFCSDACRTAYRREQLTQPFQEAGQRALQERREQGQPSNTTPDAKAHAAETNRERAALNRAYDAAQPGAVPDTAWYRAAILPRLAPLPLSAIQRATGFSLRYCSLIRQGHAVPIAASGMPLPPLSASPCQGSLTPFSAKQGRPPFQATPADDGLVLNHPTILRRAKQPAPEPGQARVLSANRASSAVRIHAHRINKLITDFPARVCYTGVSERRRASAS